MRSMISDWRRSHVSSVTMQVYDTAEWLSGRLYCNVLILRMYAVVYCYTMLLMMMMMMMCLFYTTLNNEVAYVASV
jgi:hypothetical protein